LNLLSREERKLKRIEKNKKIIPMIL